MTDKERELQNEAIAQMEKDNLERFQNFLLKESFSFSEFQNEFIQCYNPEFFDDDIHTIRTACFKHYKNELNNSNHKDIYLVKIKTLINQLQNNDLWKYTGKLENYISSDLQARFETLAIVLLKELSTLVELSKEFDFKEQKEFKSEIPLNELILLVDSLRNKGVFNNQISMKTMAEILSFVSGYQYSSVYKGMTGDDISEIREKPKYKESLKAKMADILA